MAFTPNFKQQIEQKVFSELKIRADQRLIPFLKENLREDTGQMKNATDAEVVEENGRKKLRIVIGRELNYPQFVEGRYGILKDGTKAGQVAEDWLKSLLR